MNAPAPLASCTLDTPPGASAIASVTISGDIDAALRALSIVSVRVGEAKLRNLAGVDEGVVARWTDRSATLMPHGGPRIVRELLDALRRAGIAESTAGDPLARHPEADDLIEAITLDALASATSPLAVDLLLAQPERWRRWDAHTHPLDAVKAVSARLNRLLTPPTVVAIGASNIGKSTLLNALARREAAIVHDSPGVTRDHVGVTLELDALTVRWLDTPGFRDTPDPLEREAIEIAERLAAGADLIVLCADSSSGWTPVPEGAGGVPEIRVALRADLGVAPGADLAVAAPSGKGLRELAAAVRRRLVPDEALGWEGPWLFDDRLLGAAGRVPRPRSS